jgi:hypothetical protein
MGDVVVLYAHFILLKKWNWLERLSLSSICIASTRGGMKSLFFYNGMLRCFGRMPLCGAVHRKLAARHGRGSALRDVRIRHLVTKCEGYKI